MELRRANGEGGRTQLVTYRVVERADLKRIDGNPGGTRYARKVGQQ